MTTHRNGTEILPNWTLRFEEVSNNVYYVTLTDKFGRQASITDTDLDRAIHTCEEYAFDIQKQISRDWSRFLFGYSVLLLKDTITFSNGDPKNAFGSWGISVKDRILTYDGRDDVLIAKDSNADAFDYNIKALKDLSFETFRGYIDFVKQETQPTT